ncbi:hypothetical protein ACDG46_004119 [Klebsiella pneumoniae]|uniref:hypothetical protein n=1 Tax=Klebsiella pneumoniae TaxID=573 RepID=UPI0009837690|nr:hypothetical protein [Klebsiella pneumoniae]EKV8550934.1 hypothetical protein [Klebsiella pneumoniae]MBC4875590.1 hypothetical protein [Klebsiella pneumoniae]MCA5290529.1 hypothetical protein [Klebsiella pneumoniae]MCA5301028.1 hypothetical protein [Klebsiella pneumoniae]MCA5306657.1 hypothetical protein [Klebsiella pneumoniae]
MDEPEIKKDMADCLMKTIYAQQFNKALEDYHFNSEFSGDNTMPFKVLSMAAHHLYGWFFCTGDTQAAAEMAPLLNQLRRNEVPRPFNLEQCEV